MNVDLVHAYVGCNRIVHALDWGQAELVAYGAHNAVVIYDPEASYINAKLLGHTGRVNCVKWLPSTGIKSDNGVQALVSGAADNSLIVWLLHLRKSGTSWSIAAHLQAHQGPITSLAVQGTGNGSLLLVSTSADDNVLVWGNNAKGASGSLLQQAWQVLQRISMPLILQHSVAVTTLPNLSDCMLLALGGVDNTVRLLLSQNDGEFRQVCSLTGHSNWVRSLAFTTVQAGAGQKLLLASASQDKYIRIWAVQENSVDEAKRDAASFMARYAPKPGFPVGKSSFTAILEALLIGHEDWVHSVAWQPHSNSSRSSRPCLLSASMDRTMALWRPDPATGLWMSEESVGDAGPSSLGYFGGVWSPTADAILAHGYTGALHLWRRQGLDGALDPSSAGWTPHHALGGHFGAVVDLAWSFDGSFLLSVSADQTARITANSHAGSWFEIARPQVHGHDFSCVAILPPSNDGKILFASGSEEKVIRILEAPQAFLDTLAFVRGGTANLPASTSVQEKKEERALGAAVPALGLSNKAVYASDAPTDRDGPDLAPRATPAAVSGQPLEEHLQQSTLWPEVYKVYGHGNELYCLAADPRGKFLASACKAQAADVAAVWIWRVGSWAPLQQLEAHSLTATQLAFTPDGGRLVSVSRDRSIAVWQRTPDEDAPFQLLGRILKAHTRIIWSVSCSHDESCFATGSRDNTVNIWASGSTATGLPTKPLTTLPTFKSSVHSVAFAPCHPASRESNAAAGGHILAVGLEDGGIQIFSLQMQTSGEETPIPGAVQCLWEAPVYSAHCGAVRRLVWQCSTAETEPQCLYLASGSEDQAVHVYKMLA